MCGKKIVGAGGNSFPIISFFKFILYDKGIFLFFVTYKPHFSFSFSISFITGVSAFLVFFLSSERGRGGAGSQARELIFFLAAAGTAWKWVRV